MGYVDHAHRHLPGGTDPILGLPRRMVWGSVYNDGVIIAGTGFTAANDYGDGVNFTKITFGTPFVSPPVVVLAANNNNPVDLEGRYEVSVTTTNVAYIIVRQEDIDDADNVGNGGFDFLALDQSV